MSREALTIFDVNEFLIKELGTYKFKPETDINLELGITGDDFDQLMEHYNDTFQVHMDQYLWYFHTQEEGLNLPGGLFFKAPNRKVERITITPKLLFQFAKTGTWNIDYPKHALPGKRYDLIFNRVFWIIFVSLVVILLTYKYFFRT